MLTGYEISHDKTCLKKWRIEFLTIVDRDKQSDETKCQVSVGSHMNKERERERVVDDSRT